MLKKIAMMFAAAGLAFAVPTANAQNYDYGTDWGDYEYEAGEGLHEEEWYDPSDWFDTDYGVSYETDWDDYYGYDYGLYDGFYDNYGLYDDYLYGDYGTYGTDLYDYEPDYDNVYGYYDYGYDDYGIYDTGVYDDYGYGLYDGYYTGDWYEDEGVFDEWYEDDDWF